MRILERTDQEKLQRMRQGPIMDIDEEMLVIPSMWYNEDAADLWGEQGFRYNSTLQEWIRNVTKQAADGKAYTAAQWLKAARQKFYKFYPELYVTCSLRNCNRKFVPRSRYDTLCSKCSRHLGGNWRDD